VITGPALGSQHHVAIRENAPRVLVVGGGFGGLAAVARLARRGYQVTLADRHIYASFQPLLYQVATAGLAPSDVAYPLRGFAHRRGARFRHGELASLDPAARVAGFSDGSQAGYDYLILATGVAAAFYGITGAAEHSYGLYTLHDAVSLRERIMAGLERLAVTAPPEEATVTVVGGGATGVELAGTLAELRNLALPASYPDLDPACVHIRLVEMAPGVLGPFDPHLRSYAAQQLRARGVELRLDTTIKEITAQSIVLDSGEVLRSDLTAWAAGISGPDEARRWGLPLGRGGRLLTSPDLRVQGQDRIFAIGDIALTGDDPLPQLAQPAIQMGKHAAAQIQRLEAGQATAPFTYHDKGIMATIGSRSAVVQLNHGIRFRGALAWFAWLALHLVTLLGNRNRINALINLSWRYLSWQRGGGIIMGDDPPAPGTSGLGTAQPMTHQRPLAQPDGGRGTGPAGG
jgi:NADH:quinone reductase (non-electrogenic)